MKTIMFHIYNILILALFFVATIGYANSIKNQTILEKNWFSRDLAMLMDVFEMAPGKVEYNYISATQKNFDLRFVFGSQYVTVKEKDNALPISYPYLKSPYIDVRTADIAADDGKGIEINFLKTDKDIIISRDHIALDSKDSKAENRRCTPPSKILDFKNKKILFDVEQADSKLFDIAGRASRILRDGMGIDADTTGKNFHYYPLSERMKKAQKSDVIIKFSLSSMETKSMIMISYSEVNDEVLEENRNYMLCLLQNSLSASLAEDDIIVLPPMPAVFSGEDSTLLPGKISIKIDISAKNQDKKQDTVRMLQLGSKKIINSVVSLFSPYYSRGLCKPVRIGYNGRINVVFIGYKIPDDMKINPYGMGSMDDAITFEEYLKEYVITSKDKCCGFMFIEPYASNIENFNFYYVDKPMNKHYYLYDDSECIGVKKSDCAGKGQKAGVQEANIEELSSNCPADIISIIDTTQTGGGGAGLDDNTYVAGLSSLTSSGFIHVHEMSHIFGIGDEYFFSGGNDFNREALCERGQCIEVLEPNLAISKKRALEKWGKMAGMGNDCFKVPDVSRYSSLPELLRGGSLLPEYFHATPCSIMNFIELSDDNEYDYNEREWVNNIKERAQGKNVGPDLIFVSKEQMRRGLGPVSEEAVRKQIV